MLPPCYHQIVALALLVRAEHRLVLRFCDIGGAVRNRVDFLLANRAVKYSFLDSHRFSHPHFKFSYFIKLIDESSSRYPTVFSVSTRVVLIGIIAITKNPAFAAKNAPDSV